ncbi:uncharacterized protein [Miscanthus floridulus]|uniref:uncharacterized protein n=1 Tax=Miscanthus floridulus TaxID=154761 RepID=UPI003458FA5C
MASGGAYPVQVLHLPGGGDGGHWSNLGAAYAAVTFLRPQGQSLVLYAAGPNADGQQRQQQPRGRIVLVYPILPGDAFERLDGATLSWAEPESGAEFALCFADEAACAAVCGAISASPLSTMVSPVAAVDGVAERLAGLRVARDEATPAPAPAPGGADIAARLAQLSIGR